jgi:hypothetical protein
MNELKRPAGILRLHGIYLITCNLVAAVSLPKHMPGILSEIVSVSDSLNEIAEIHLFRLCL